MDENLYWQQRMVMQKTVAALGKHGFRTVGFDSRDQALAFLLEEAASAQTIGFGGSMTLTELGLAERIAALGKQTLIHGQPGLTPEQRRTIMQAQLGCDLFFTSTNAVTQDGILVNIDATGNRVCSMAFGPKKVWIVAGSNKVTVDLHGALQRIKVTAAPANARRLGFKTPCASTGVCCDCDSPDRICRMTTIIERKPRATDIGICLINENLGY